ncbi:MAG: serine/threonine protein kinase [Acidobacteria bacterium]|nr:serine/threonine protein kinase [Acidobacteriota bacterium]
MVLTLGTKLGPYKIQFPLGACGMVEVYRAKDVRLHRKVAMKILASYLSFAMELKQRMECEARAISALNHSNVRHLYGIGAEKGIDSLVMEFLERETLAERLHRGALPLTEIYRIGIAMSQALAVAHRAGIVHRDLKPANIMLTKGAAKLMDFCFAKSAWGGTAGCSLAPLLSAPTMSEPSPVSLLTMAGSIVGTIQYMCPEQIEGKEVNSRFQSLRYRTIRNGQWQARLCGHESDCGGWRHFGERSRGHLRSTADGAPATRPLQRVLS